MSGVKEKVNMIDVVPCHSAHIRTVKEGEEVILSFPRFKHNWMNRFLVPKGMSKEIHVHLEVHGTAVWELIDGNRTVHDIITQLAAHFNGEAGYESRVLTYLLRMQKDGFIRFLIKR